MYIMYIYIYTYIYYIHLASVRFCYAVCRDHFYYAPSLGF